MRNARPSIEDTALRPAVRRHRCSELTPTGGPHLLREVGGVVILGVRARPADSTAASASPAFAPFGDCRGLVHHLAVLLLVQLVHDDGICVVAIAVEIPEPESLVRVDLVPWRLHGLRVLEAELLHQDLQVPRVGFPKDLALVLTELRLRILSRLTSP